MILFVSQNMSNMSFMSPIPTCHDLSLNVDWKQVYKYHYWKQKSKV